MSKNILIVDDSESIRELISFTLKTEGYSVMIGKDGVDAGKFIDGRHIDLVITDLHMPHKDGIEFIKDVRNSEHYKTIPILFLTTESQTEKKLMAKEAGATGWIIKPFVPDKLKAAIKKVLR
ncbi:MAG: two-component system response regulator [Salinivirgaceae bacterium]|nr:MAG: two-component system response regulator [Salinivirgaceae bacterium]